MCLVVSRLAHLAMTCAVSISFYQMNDLLCLSVSLTLCGAETKELLILRELMRRPLPEPLTLAAKNVVYFYYSIPKKLHDLP